MCRLEFLNEHAVRPRYLDNEDNWINLNFDDQRGFSEVWQCARGVANREFKRAKLRAGVLGAAIQAAVASRISSSSTTARRPVSPFPRGWPLMKQYHKTDNPL